MWSEEFKWTYCLQSPSTVFKGMKKYTAAADPTVNGRVSQNIHRLAQLNYMQTSIAKDITRLNAQQRGRQ
jgi:hypothetical protein